jgi:hypothetical protein
MYSLRKAQAIYKNRKVCGARLQRLIVTKINDIITYIIPFFDKYKIEGPAASQLRSFAASQLRSFAVAASPTKYKDYVNFKEAATLIKNKEHLTEKGLNKIIELKKYMNKND